MGLKRIEPGATLDGFQIGERCHNGNMATLWEVTRPDIDFPILMKVPKLTEGADPAAIVSFEMEQMILSRLSGPHVPRFVANGDFAVQPYIVMERIPGTSLLPFLEKLPLPYAEAVDIGSRIATALDDIHRQNVVHLDVKPSNIMIRPTGEAVLIDFGLSHHNELPDFMAEEFRLPYGTAPYMAPEQVLGHRRDPRSDQFALGVLLYFFTTNSRPFGDPQTLSGLKHRLWRDPVPPRYLRHEFPPWLQEVIFRCLEVNPAWRYPTSNQLAFDLQHSDQVKLTARSTRFIRDHFITVLKRRFRANLTHPVTEPTVARYGADAPIVAVAIDLSETTGTLVEELRTTVARILGTLPGARLACLNVFKIGIITLDNTIDKNGNNKYVQRMVELRHWAEPLKLEGGRVSVHVLESPRPAEAILWYARTNRVDHIVMGARADSTKRTLLGSVSGKVAAHAPCTVTVVRSGRSGNTDYYNGADDLIEAAGEQNDSGSMNN